MDETAVQALIGEAADAELHRYPGVGHLFMDADLPDYDKVSADLAFERILTFLNRI